ncbi:MAG: carboxynorspermidine decarboxylase [Oscillospiraceae bacterium]|nr:carboxynorspermidine decarboxylase [Oscillospiraceae bacterium]
MLESALPSPCYLMDQSKLKQNLMTLDALRQRSGCRILFSQKAFSSFPFYSMIARYLDGASACSAYEAQLAHLYFHGENHVCQTAYLPEEMDELLKICDHITFNSPSQLERYAGEAHAHGVSVGLRINPEYLSQQIDEFDPCAPFSRLGTTVAQFPMHLRRQINGLHVHALYEQNSDALYHLVNAVLAKFGALLPEMEWINLGGGHHITREGYQTERLEEIISILQSRFGLKVYLEPGEAIVWEAGYFITTVVDLIQNGMPIAILDASAVCHASDITEVRYHPPLIGADKPSVKPFTYRLGGRSCLPEDVFGDYSFDHKLEIGERLVFKDMAINTLTKARMYTGMPMPAVAVREPDGSCKILRTFNFSDYKNRF